MSKHKRKQQPTNQRVNIVLPSDMSAEQMKEIIADAIILADKRKNENIDNAHIIEIEELSKITILDLLRKYFNKLKKNKINLQDIKKAVVSTPASLWYALRLIIVIRLYPDKKIKGDKMIFQTQKTFLKIVFKLFEILVVIMAFCLPIIQPFCDLFGLSVFPYWCRFLVYSFYSVILLFVATMLYIIREEIAELQDRNYMFSFSAYVLSMITMIVTVLPFVLNHLLSKGD